MSGEQPTKGGAAARGATSHDEAHASADELALFVLDALEPAARRHLERHVAVCHDCARGLAAEAAAEEALAQAWPLVPRPLAPVLSLPVRPPVVAPAPVARPRRLDVRRQVLAGNSWGNGLAAAVLTVLFVGYWNDGNHRPAARVVDGAALGAEALCPLDVFTPAPLLIASVEPDPRAPRMCTSPDADSGGLCQEPAVSCMR